VNGHAVGIPDASRYQLLEPVLQVVDVAARFDAERRAAATSTIWSTGCKSWYLDASGLPTAWPFTFDRFRAEMARPRFEDWVAHDGA